MSQDCISLDEIDLFQNLSLSERTVIFKNLTECFFNKGEILFQQENPCNGIFIIRSGQVRIFLLSASGKEQVLETLGPGDTCACNPGTVTWKCVTTAQAVSDTHVWVLPRAYYSQKAKSNSQFASALNQLFAEKFCRCCSLIETITFDDPQQRLIKFILKMHDGHEHMCITDKCLCIPFTVEEIAQRLGLVRETVSRHLHRLKRRRLIDLQSRRIVILERNKLQDLLGKSREHN